jgi:ketosteroid isomerase-like protein
MTIGYAEAGLLLDAFARAYETFDGDLVVSLFTDDAEYHEDPFAPPLVGHNAIRRYWLDAAETQDQVEFTFERHWVSGGTVIAVWHMSWRTRGTTDRFRASGVLVLDIRDGSIARLREWWHGRRATDGTTDEAQGGAGTDGR